MRLTVHTSVLTFLTMETTKIYLRPRLLLTFDWLSMFACCFFSCDVLEPDADILSPDVKVSQDPIYVYSSNATFIDLASKIHANQPVRFKVTAPPVSGSLSDLGKGLLQYTPSGASLKKICSGETTDAVMYYAFP